MKTMLVVMFMSCVLAAAQAFDAGSDMQGWVLMLAGASVMVWHVR